MNSDFRGTLALLGSGETSSQGRKIHDYLMASLGKEPPISVALLQTPAGFQPNVDLVYRKVGEFFEKSLQNFQPQPEYIRAHRKGTPEDPDSHDVVKGLLDADYIFTGPGSPTYAARNLSGTRAIAYTVEAFSRGATVVLSSAAAVAAGAHVVRVYEIFKAGADLGWDPGLNLLDALGIGVSPVIVTHWNNTEGGAGLDTTHCYMGKERFDRLVEMLPSGTPILGIDEHTACIFEPGAGEVRVMGAGGATVIAGGEERYFRAATSFPLELLAAAEPTTRR